MRWVKRIVIGIGAILVLLVIAAGVLWIWKPWVPPVVMTDPAPAGRRIASGDLIGNFYPAVMAGAHPGILLLGGSEGALGSGPTRIAKALQAQGFAVFHIAYFRAPGQSETLALVPLELFDHALTWLARQPGVDPARLAVVGASKGGEAAMLVATRHPELRAVVAGMPSNVVWPGVDWESFGETRSSWSAHGRPLPALPYGEGSFGGEVSDIYVRGLAALPKHPAARIPIERAEAPILLVCGEADSLWPSCPMARALVRTKRSITLLAYRDAGHGVFGPPWTPDAPAFKSLGRMGGSDAGNNAARRDGWPKILAFLHKGFDAR